MLVLERVSNLIPPEANTLLKLLLLLLEVVVEVFEFILSDFYLGLIIDQAELVLLVIQLLGPLLQTLIESIVEDLSKGGQGCPL